LPGRFFCGAKYTTVSINGKICLINKAGTVLPSSADGMKDNGEEQQRTDEK